MIYQPRRSKTLLFERVIKVTAHLVPSDETMTFYYLCLCCRDRGRTCIVRVIRPVHPPPAPVYYYGSPLYEDLREHLN